MNRKSIGILVALALAAVGTVALVAYVRNAEERALAGEELVEVYVVKSTVPGGTAGEDLEPFLTVEQVPAKVRAEGSVDDLSAATGRVTAVDLLPGEQLVDSRLVTRSDYAQREGVTVPDDMEEITVSLEPQRAIGGLVEPGQTVSVFSSFEPFKLTATTVDVNGQTVALPDSVASDVSGSTPNVTKILMRKVLVTAVQRAPRVATVGNNDQEVDRLTTAPDGELLVTLALRPEDASRVVFTAEFGTLWLAVEKDTVPLGGDQPVTRGNVLDDRAPAS